MTAYRGGPPSGPKMLKTLTGRVFSRLTVLSRAPNKSGRTTWLCRCDCGNEKTIRSYHLLLGKTTSCGNHPATGIESARYKHGQTRTYLYWCWLNIISRCENQNADGYKNYGGRGITVCASWRNSFSAFASDMGHRPSSKHSIDRRDTNGNYEPDNCRWATKSEQARNRRNNRIVRFLGTKMPLIRAAELSGVPYHVAQYRLNRGLNIEQTFGIDPSPLTAEAESEAVA